MKKLEARNVNVFYGPNQVIKDVSISIKKNTVTKKEIIQLQKILEIEQLPYLFILN